MKTQFCKMTIPGTETVCNSLMIDGKCSAKCQTRKYPDTTTKPQDNIMRRLKFNENIIFAGQKRPQDVGGSAV